MDKAKVRLSLTSVIAHPEAKGIHAEDRSERSFRLVEVLEGVRLHCGSGRIQLIDVRFLHNPPPRRIQTFTQVKPHPVRCIHSSSDNTARPTQQGPSPAREYLSSGVFVKTMCLPLKYMHRYAVQEIIGSRTTSGYEYR